VEGGRAGRRSAWRLLAWPARPVLRGMADAVGLSAAIGWDGVALGDDAPGLLEGDLTAVEVAHDIAFAAAPAGTIRVSNAAAM